MVAYSFKSRFVEPILAGTKRQTIRADRKRHARPGEELQLYTGMRTKKCKLIARAECESVHVVHLDIAFRGAEIDGVWLALDDDFARADGFRDMNDMERFWDKEHPGSMFDGVLIRWRPLQPVEHGDEG